MRLFKVLTPLTLVLLLATAYASASTITYAITGYGTGSLNGVGFTDTPFIFIGSTNPTTIRGNLINVQSPFFDIFGVGSGTFANPYVFVNHHDCYKNGHVGLSCVGIGDTHGDFVDIYNDILATYDLQNAIGPVFDSTPGPDIGISHMTSAGDLIFTGLTNGYFTATLTHVIPEPSSLALLGIGIAGAAGLLRQKLRL